MVDVPSIVLLDNGGEKKFPQRELLTQAEQMMAEQTMRQRVAVD